MKIGQRVVEIVIKAKDDASGAVKKLGESFDELKRQVPLLGQAFDLLKNPLAQVIVILASLSKAAVDAYNANVQLGAAMDDVSKRTDLSVESLAKWGYITQLSGSSLGEFESAYKRLRQSMADAMNGNQQAIDSFTQLEVNFKNLDGSMRPVEATMLDIGQAIRRFGENSVEAAAGQNVLGRGAGALIAVIKQAPEDFERLSRDAVAATSNMTTAWAEAGAAAEDTADRIKAAQQNIIAGFQSDIKAKASYAWHVFWMNIFAPNEADKLWRAQYADVFAASRQVAEGYVEGWIGGINDGKGEMVDAVAGAAKEALKNREIDKAIADLRSKIAESMTPDKDRSMLDITPRLGEGAEDGLMLWEDYEEEARKLLTLQEEIDAYGLPDPLNAMKIAEANAQYEALVKKMEEAARATEQVQQAVMAGVNSLASGLGDVGGAAAEAFLTGETHALKLGSMIRNVVIKAIRDMIAELIRVKVLMAALKFLGLPMAEGGSVPGRAHGGAVSRAANGYAIPDGPRGMDSRLILGMPGEEVINRSLSRRLDRFISAYEMSATVSPFALAGAGGGGNVINFNVGRPVSVLDALDLGRNAVTASRKYSEASL